MIDGEAGGVLERKGSACGDLRRGRSVGDVERDRGFRGVPTDPGEGSGVQVLSAFCALRRAKYVEPLPLSHDIIGIYFADLAPGANYSPSQSASRPVYFFFQLK